jgi:hypothetical protein
MQLRTYLVDHHEELLICGCLSQCRERCFELADIDGMTICKGAKPVMLCKRSFLHAQDVFSDV